MKQTIQIDQLMLTRAHCPGGWTKIKSAGETIGMIETIKLLDDLLRLLNRPLTDHEQQAVIDLAPRLLRMAA